MQPNAPFKSRIDLKNDGVYARQIAFFAAFVLPMYKLLEVPSLLARFSKGDLLLPAFLQFLLQTGVIVALLFVASRSEKTLFERMEETLGKWSIAVYILCAVYFLFAAALPLLDLEKFIYAAFYDTSPTFFSFAAFFLFCGYACTRGLKSVGRSADLSLFLFLLPFLILLVMAFTETDVTNLLPLFEQKPRATLSAITYTAPHFSDAALLLPLIGNLRFQKNDGKKIVAGYWAGAVCVLVFLGVFFGLYSTIAPREHYAFAKIAQYFPVLSVIGRIDLLLVYLLSVVLFFSVSAPLQYAVHFLSQTAHTKRKTLFATAVVFAAFLFALFCNKHYNFLYSLFCERLYPLFWIFATLAPLAFLLLNVRGKRKRKEADRA